MNNNINPVRKDIVLWANSMTGTDQQRAAFIAQFEGWSDDKQREMAEKVMIEKLRQLSEGIKECFKPTWWEKILSWIGL